MTLESQDEPTIAAATPSAVVNSRALTKVAIALFVLSRLYLMFVVTPGHSDTALYWSYAVAGIDFGNRPYQQLQVEYPPVAWWLMAAVRYVDPVPLEGATISKVPAHLRKASLERYQRIFRWTMLCCDVAALALYAAVARRLMPRSAGIVLVGYVVATGLLSHLVYDRLDAVLLLLFMAWAYAWQRSLESSDKQEVWQMTSYAVLGISFAFKIIPILMAPFLLLAEWRSPDAARRLRQSILVFTLFGMGPFLIQYASDGGAVFALFKHHLERAIQLESIYATVLLGASWLNMLQVGIGHSHGAYELASTASRGMKFCSTVVLFGMLLGVWLWAAVQRRRFDHQWAFATALWVICAATIVSNVLSPQYFVWAFPLTLLLAGMASGDRPATAISVGLVVWLVSAMTTWIFPYHYLDDEGTGAYALVPHLRRGIVAVLMLRNVMYFAVVAALGGSLLRRMRRGEHIGTAIV